ncbi:MAG: hypothetical protein ACYC7D_14960 [Nitrososphaerales archaeon]
MPDLNETTFHWHFIWTDFSINVQNSLVLKINLELNGSARSRARSDTALVIYVAAIGFAIHVFFGTNYGYFRDELYYK